MKFKLLTETTDKKYKLYTNGEKTLRVYDGDPVPDGYRPGQHHSHTPWNKGLTKDDERVKQNIENTQKNS